MTGDGAGVSDATFEVEVGGNRLDPASIVVVGVRVEERLISPSVCVVDLVEPWNARRSWVPAVRDKVVVRIAKDGRRPVTVFDGEVTGWEVESGVSGTNAMLRCFDRGHRLQRGARTRSFLETTIDAVVRKVAVDAGLRLGDIRSTPAMHSQISQVNVDDWTFLQDLAARVGWTCSLQRGRLSFGPIEAIAGTATLQLDRWSTPVVWMRGSMSAAQQVEEVEVRAWDPALQVPIIGRATVGTGSAQRYTSSGNLASPFSPPPMIVTSQSVLSTDEANEVAAGIASRTGGTMVEMEAELVGDPELRPGIGARTESFPGFEGSLVLTDVSHIWTENDGYRVRVGASDRQDRSLLGLIGAGSDRRSDLMGTLVPAVVSDIDDPEGLDRVRVQLPWLDDRFVTGWARTVQLGAGPGRGARFVPEVSDEVLVGFEHGDVHRPYVIGGLSSGKQRPFEGAGDVVKGGRVLRRVLSSRTGHHISLSDDPSDPTITIETGDGKTTLVVGGQDGMTITSASGILLTTQGSIDLAAGGDVTISGRNVTLEAEQSLDLSGVTKASMSGIDIAVKAESQLALSGSAGASLSGAIVELN